jgi:DNA-binding SARP family transcriptional activator
MGSEAMDVGVRVELLGGFRVLAGGEAVAADAWTGRRSAELVQLLALAEGHRLTRDQAIEALWPRLDPKAGAGNLRKAAHYARRALGTPDAIVLRGGQVSLFPSGSVTTDAERFEADAAAALADGRAERCAAVADTYAGDLLPEAIYEDWTQEAREHLRSRQAELLRRGEQWGRLVQLEPTDEAAYRELMRRELSAGSRPAAIRWYGRLRDALRREIGIAPSAESQAIYEECVAGLGTAAPVFIGRQVELARAGELLRAEPGDGPSALVIRGPAGIGQTTLCQELAAAGRAEGWAVIAVAADEAEVPYAPVVNAIEQLLAADRGLLEAIGGPARSVLAELTPLASPADARDRPLTRHEVIGAVRRLLAAGDRPIALIVDDTHLADEATIDLLLHLGSSGAPIRTLLAYRPEPAPEALTRGVARLTRAQRAIEIDLEPLDSDETAALVTAGSPTPRAADVVERIVDLSQGNPFLALELARSAVAGVPALAPTARDAIAAKFLDLDRDAALMLGRLALVGDALDPVAVVALTGASEREAFELLDVALEAGVLIVAGARYRFRHELVRQALVEQLSPHRRLALHREIAQRLAEAGASAGLIARHWLEGKRPDDAEEWLLTAARQAMDLGAFDDALTHLDPVLDNRPRHRDALCLRAEALDALGDAEAPAAYATAAEVAGGQPAHELRAKQALATVKLGNPAGGLEVAQGLEPQTVEGRLAHALAFCGAATLGVGDPEIGAAKAAEARRLALESGDRNSLVIASWANAGAAHARGELHSSVRTDLYDTSALPGLAVSVFDGQLCITQRFLYGARPYPEVIEFADSLAAEADRLGAARGRAFAVTIRGEAKLLAGRLDEADRDLQTGAELHHQLAAAAGEAFATQRRAETALLRGEPQHALVLLDEALAIARESDVGFHLFDRIYGARILAAPDPDSALSALEEAEAAVRGPIETCPGCRITLAVPAAIAAACGGDLERAERWEQESEYLANVVMRLPAWYAALEEVRAHRAQAGGDVVAAVRHFNSAAAGYTKAGQPLDGARCAALARNPARAASGT